MRKMFVSACLFAAMAFTACTTEVIYVDSDGNPVEHVDLKEGEGLLSVAVSSTDVSTRDVRPVGSSAAANNVNVVKVYAFSADAEEGTYYFDNTVGVKDGQEGISGTEGIITITMDGPVSDYIPSTGIHIEETEKITLTGLDPAKYYKFVAVGYNDANGQVNPYGEPSLAAGTTSLTAFTSTAKTGYGVEELFATQSANATKGDVKNQGTLTLTRQVAGMLAYFTNVPATIDGKSVAAIRIYANKSFTQFTYPATGDFNGKTAGSDNDLLMEFIMADISTGTDADGYYTFNTLSKGSVRDNGSSNNGKAPVANGYNMPSGLTLKDNSIFGGRYLIPYDQHYDTPSSSTLIVKLEDGESSPLRTLKVTTDQTASGVDKYAYDIRCNNFYSIGTKTDVGGSGDKPIDIQETTGYDYANVSITSDWSDVHDLVN